MNKFVLAILLSLFTFPAFAACSSSTNGIAQTYSQLATAFASGQAAGSIDPGCLRNLLASTYPGVAPFSESKGQILDPTGKPFIAKGINIADWAAVQNVASSGSNNGQNVPVFFPGINMVRLNMEANAGLPQFSGNTSVAAVSTFIANMTAQHIVVVVEDHSVAGGTSNCLSGSALTTETTWYNSFAVAYANNPYVWFGTMNEPDNVADQSVCTAQETAIYNTIRGAGNNNPIMLEMIGGYTVTGFSPTPFATMTNTLWYTHFYAWVASNSPLYAPNAVALTAQIANAQTVPNASGVMPVVVGEFGISTAGSSPDVGGTPVVKVVEASGYGALAWTWQEGASDMLVTSGTTLTTYGQDIAAWIAGNLAPGPVLGTSQYGTQTAANVGPSGTWDFQFFAPSTPTFSIGGYSTVTVTARDQANGNKYAVAFNYMVGREGSGASITNSAKIGEIGTAGTIAFGSGTLQLSWISVATDGGTYLLHVVNTSGTDTFSVWANQSPNGTGNAPALGP